MMNSKPKCDICAGRRYIRLPVIIPLTAAPFSGAFVPEVQSREYPCPECAGFVKEERVAVLDVHSMIDVRYEEDPDFSTHIRLALVHQLIGQLLRGDFISFERGRSDTAELNFPMVATVGVVAKGTLKTLEQRIVERQDQVARVVAQEAKKQIDNWGSYYGHAKILKRDAREQIDSALKRVLGEWSRAREVTLKSQTER